MKYKFKIGDLVANSWTHDGFDLTRLGLGIILRYVPEFVYHDRHNRYIVYWANGRSDGRNFNTWYWPEEDLELMNRNDDETQI